MAKAVVNMVAKGGKLGVMGWRVLRTAFLICRFKPKTNAVACKKKPVQHTSLRKVTQRETTKASTAAPKQKQAVQDIVERSVTEHKVAVVVTGNDDVADLRRHSVATTAAKLGCVGWKVLRTALKNACRFKRKTNIVTHKAEEVQDTFRHNVAEHKVALVITTEDDPWDLCQQGDASAYTTQAIAARKQIARSEKTVSLITLLWECVVLAKEEAPRDRIRRQTFVSLITNFHQLLQHPKPKEMIVSLAEEDWVRDMGKEAAASGATMTYVQFFLSVFELVDTWCATLHAPDYWAMLTAILEYTQLVLPLKGDGIATQKWLNQHDDIARLRGVAHALLEGEEVSTSSLASLESLEQWRDVRLQWTMEEEGVAGFSDGAQRCLVRGDSLMDGMSAALESYFDAQAQHDTGDWSGNPQGASIRTDGTGDFAGNNAGLGRESVGAGLGLDDSTRLALQFRNHFSTEESTQHQRFKVGARVQVKRDGAWCTGVVVKVSDGLYDVRYDQRDSAGGAVNDYDLPPYCLRALDEDDSRSRLAAQYAKQGFDRFPGDRTFAARGDGTSSRNVHLDSDTQRERTLAGQQFRRGEAVMVWMNNKWVGGVVARFNPEDNTYMVKADGEVATWKVSAKCLKAASTGATTRPGTTAPGRKPIKTLLPKKTRNKVNRHSSKRGNAWKGAAHQAVKRGHAESKYSKKNPSERLALAANGAPDFPCRGDLTQAPSRQRRQKSNSASRGKTKHKRHSPNSGRSEDSKSPSTVCLIGS